MNQRFEMAFFLFQQIRYNAADRFFVVVVVIVVSAVR